MIARDCDPQPIHRALSAAGYVRPQWAIAGTF